MTKLNESWPRQPFVGLAVAAAIGIVCADYAPNISRTVLVTIAASAAIALVWRRSIATYAFVAASFFYLHSLQLIDTPGLKLADTLGQQSVNCTARGVVVSEPKLSPNGF